jgi:hypothetical protein
MIDANGYKFWVTVGAQTSEMDSMQPVKMWYEAPTIYTVTPSGRTAGGDNITIVGLNFGTTTPSVWIGSNAAGGPGMLPCTNVWRGSSTRVYCRLAEGSGSFLDVIVRVSNQQATLAASFSYNPPVFTNITIGGMTFNPYGRFGLPVVMWGDSAGSYPVTLYGDNFGNWSNQDHCLFVAWRGRDEEAILNHVPANQLMCDGMWGFLGEGEVPAYGIVNWTHTKITFKMLPGSGARDIVTVVRGQKQTIPIVFQYNAPNIGGSLTPNHGTTDGSDTITAHGASFGVLPRNTLVSGPYEFPKSFPATWDEFVAMEQPPLALFQIKFFKICMFDTYTNTRSKRQSVDACRANLIKQRSDTAITFLSVPGIGANRSVTFSIIDRVPSADIPNAYDDLILTSNVVLFNYDKPFITSSFPNPVYMRDLGSYEITLAGTNLGTPPNPGEEQWSDEEKSVAVNVSSVACTGAQRFTDGTTQQQKIVCQMEEKTVGYKNLTYNVAGQLGATNGDSAGAVFVVCGVNFFGRPGEECLPCPVGALCQGYQSKFVQVGTLGGTLVLKQMGNHTYPAPQPGFFDLNSTDSMYDSCPEMIAGQYPGRDVCVSHVV